MKYEEAIDKLELISRQLESGNMPIDQMSEKLKAAQHLIKFCREQLLEVEEQLRKN